MDLHQEGRRLVEDIIRRKRIRLHLDGIPECERCTVPRPGPCIIVCPEGCRLHLCPCCAEETMKTPPPIAGNSLGQANLKSTCGRFHAPPDT